MEIDATVLAPAFLWVGGWIVRDSRLRDRDAPLFWNAVYWLYPALALPTAFLIKLQLSVVILAWLFFTVSKRAIEVAREDAAA